MKQSSLDTSKYPIELTRYIGWFPSFILVEKSHYDAVKEKRIKSLKASVFNGEVPDSPNLPISQVSKEKKLPINGPSLLSWIEKEMQVLSTGNKSYPTISAPDSTPATMISNDHHSIDIGHATCSKYKLKSRFSRS